MFYYSSTASTLKAEWYGLVLDADRQEHHWNYRYSGYPQSGLSYAYLASFRILGHSRIFLFLWALGFSGSYVLPLQILGLRYLRLHYRV